MVGCDPNFSGGLVCSGHGYCDVTSTCVCDPDWFSVGDFYIEYQSCAQNRTAIRSLGIILAIFSGAVLPMKISFTYLRVVTPMAQSYIKNVQSIFGLISVIYDLSYFTYGAMKALNPEYFILGDSSKNIGIDFLLFVMSATMLTLTCVIALNMTHLLLGTLRLITSTNHQSARKLINFLRHWHIPGAISGICVSLIPFFSRGWPQHSNALNLAFLVGFWLISTLQLLTNVAMLTIAANDMREYATGSALESYLEGTKTKSSKVYKTLSINRRILAARIIVAQGLWLIFSVSTYLRRYFSRIS